jgi:hypothetical protein
MTTTKEYKAAHKWLAYYFGKASKCECAECTGRGKRFEYALKKGCEHAKNRYNYIMLCASCHRKYDLTPQKVEKLKEPRKSVNHETPVTAINQLSATGKIINTYPSIMDAHLQTKINRNSIYNVVAGTAKTAGGYIFSRI